MTSTFLPNQRLPVHRWLRYSAGFSGAWAEAQIRERTPRGATVLDPFAGVATAVIAAQRAGRAAIGLEAHPFVARIARAKLAWTSDAGALERAGVDVLALAREVEPPRGEPEAPLLATSYAPDALASLRRLEVAIERATAPHTPERALTWLALVAILRACSRAGTAPWQYVLPKKTKARIAEPFARYQAQIATMVADLSAEPRPDASVLCADARTCEPVGDTSVDLVLTSPPYPNNFDYADATRLEQTFLGELGGWGDLHRTTRRHLVCACSQHASAERLELAPLLEDALLAPIRPELAPACTALAAIRRERRGRKAYHTMIAAYFADMARVFRALARVVRPGGHACFVVGDSAPYGVHVPADRWLVALAEASGFAHRQTRPVRARNVKWKNRKHRVPLREVELWLDRTR